MIAFTILVIVAILAAPAIVIARRQRQGPGVLRWVPGKGWTATYRRLR